jgi:hypothetical protein
MCVTETAAEKEVYEAVGVQYKLQWRSQDAGDARNVEHLPSKATDNKWSKHKRETMWALCPRGSLCPRCWIWSYRI